MKKLSIFIVVLVLALFFGCDSGTDSPKPPQVSFLQPADGDTLSGAYSIIVTATGDNGIDYIRFFWMKKRLDMTIPIPMNWK